MRFVNIAGQKFGKWTVLSHLKGKSWLCQCDCGRQQVADGTNLRGGKSNGCIKCRHGNHSLPKGVAAFNAFIAGYKRAAKKRNLIWDLSNTDFKTLIGKACVYCGAAPKLIKYARHRANGYITVNGVDRQNSKVGYTKANCVPCCKICNFMKLNFSISDFITQAKRISDRAVSEAL